MGAAPAASPPLTSTTPPGAVHCPACKGHEWSASRTALLWVFVIITFPIGLLFLLIPPAWRCAGCGYTYRGGQRPPGVVAPEPSGVGYTVAKVVAVLVIVGLLVFLFTASRILE